MIPSGFIQDLLARVDIVEVVARHVELKKAGVNHKGLCPFHGEKTPSFIVSPTRQTYHCFGCGVHGNAIGFLMEHLGLGFPEAVRELAQGAGLTVPETEASPEERERAAALKERQATLGEVLAKAADHYRARLKATPRAIAYLQGRGLSGRIAAQFGLGYAPPGWRGLASAFPRYDDPLLEEGGLVIRHDGDDADGGGDGKRYDRFRDRIMFPIRSVQGTVIGFGGRVLDQGEPKYLNSPETPLFSKGRELYGLYEARQALRQRGHALVVEGYMDVVALAQLGFPNAVATLGTACTDEHVRKLLRFTDSVVFSFDGDAAGRRAAARALEAALPHANDTRSIRFLFLPAQHDPDSFVREHGSEAFERCVQAAVPLSRQLVDVGREDCDLGTAEGRARFLSQARPLWSALPDGALKRQLLGELAQLGRLEAADLAGLWGHGTPAAAPGPRRAAVAPGIARRPRLPNRAPPGPADHALRMLLVHSDWWERLGADDHELLHALPGEHGELAAWLERQLAEHGPLPWSALASALTDDALAEAAQRLVPASALEDAAEFDELRRVLDLMRVEQLKAEETRLITQAGSDPAALGRWREVHERRRRLESVDWNQGDPGDVRF